MLWHRKGNKSGEMDTANQRQTRRHTLYPPTPGCRCLSTPVWMLRLAPGPSAPGEGALPYRSGRKRTHLRETCRTGFRDSAIPLGSPARQAGGSWALGQCGPRLLGRPGDLSPGSKHARNQSEDAWAGQLLRVRSGREAEPSRDPSPGCRLLSSAASDATSQVRPDVACAGPREFGVARPACRIPSPVITSEDHAAPLVLSVSPGPVNRYQQDPGDPGICSRGRPHPRLRAGLNRRGPSPISCLWLGGDPRGCLGRGLEKMNVEERNLA